MASNKNLIKEANELAAELKLAINTDGRNNKALSALVSDLKAKQRDAANDTQADIAETVEHEVGETGAALMETPATADDTEGDAPEPAAEPAKAFPFSVAAGKAITTKRGILAEGEEIAEVDLSGGKDSLEALVKSGHVKKA